jgi:low affinity Fe/Cu permease
VRLARGAARLAGQPAAFLGAAASVVLWACAGPLFGFSDTWQLVINTGTTILTFLMVFLLQSTQNRDAEAVQIKLDELLRAVEGARNSLVQLENLSQEELDSIRKNFEQVATHARRQEPSSLPQEPVVSAS